LSSEPHHPPRTRGYSHAPATQRRAPLVSSHDRPLRAAALAGYRVISQLTVSLQSVDHRKCDGVYRCSMVAQSDRQITVS